MSQLDTMARYASEVNQPPFVERRKRQENVGANERRQFGNSYRELSPQAKELAEAIDQYKLQHHRRYITAEELLGVIQGLGYRRND